MNIPLIQTYRLLAGYLAPHRGRVALLAALLLLGNALQVAGPLALGRFVDVVAAGGASEASLSFALLFLGVALLAQIVSVAASYVGEDVAWRATNALRADVTLHCAKLDMTFHNACTPGELVERVDGDVTALAGLFSTFAVRIVGSLLLLIGVLLALFWRDWRAGVGLTMFALFTLLLLQHTRNLAVPHWHAERQISGELFGFLEERLAGREDIRSCGAESYVMRRLDALNRRLRDQAQRAMLWHGAVLSTTFLIFALGNALALSLGAYLLFNGAATIGTVYLFFFYTDMALRYPILQLAGDVQSLQRSTAGIGRIQELFDIEQETRSRGQGSGARGQGRIAVQEGRVTLLQGPLAVAFERVSFTYRDEERRMTNDRETPSNLQSPISQPAPTLHNISFTLHPGETLGLLGRTGSGKTTLARLLGRLYNPSSGAILLDGANLGNIDPAEARRRVGVVTQDVQLFHAGVRDNLTFFDRTIPDDIIIQALQELELGEWYAGLPRGLDTPIGPGAGGLSGGEAQLLAFARVFLRDPGLIILDEASARLDPVTERRIEQAIARLLRHRTAIIIAHRLSTVQRVDTIMVLEGGRIREYGPREQLANASHSRFAELLRTGEEIGD